MASEQVQEGFKILRSALSYYVCGELKQEFGEENWWKESVIDTLYEEQKRDLPASGGWEDLTESLDIARCLLLFDLHWQSVFRKKLSAERRTWAKELASVRNRLAHLGGKEFSDDDTWRALDTMFRLCDQIDEKRAEEIRGLLLALRYGSPDGSIAIREKSVEPAVLSASTSGQRSWREIIKPHPDVAQGRYKNVEFAADLAQVARGEGEFEYLDPVEFFARTYVTEGMAGLMEQALRRVTGRGGDPVIQLKTVFGGGKTHSMLALYHMLRGRIGIDKIPNVKPALQRAGLTSLPKAHAAVLVGTSLNPAESKPGIFERVTINTLWGDMAAQLAVSTGNYKLYDHVRESDIKGVSPGSEALKNLFDAATPSIILMDELVAYAKKLHGKNGLPAGTFDNFITFVQEVTEAARASKNTLIVASIPESEIEIGDGSGKIALEAIEHTFGRMESIWKPVAANEGFEVVRRRLFLDCEDQDGRSAVCSKFSQMYSKFRDDFPVEVREAEYRDRLISCYPIHPEVFDRLYEDWATLERFQRTRGVLRLMSAVIHELWMNNDESLMIMPGSIPLDAPNVRDELTRHLPDAWNAIVDHEVDGKNSIPFQKDQSNPRYGSRMAARRVARSVMLGSAPTDRSQNVRGIEASHVRLGIIQPGENIADFNDALNTLTQSLAYLYTSGTRYWFDVRPTLRKTASDRAAQMSDSDVKYEIERRLRRLRKEPPAAGIHICPASTLDVPDEQNARLVILRPADEYETAAMTACEDILNNRGSSPRTFRNTLAFIAADRNSTANLKQAVSFYLAWDSIKNESEALNLDAVQNRETENNLRRADETVNTQIKETYCWLIFPHIDKDADMKTILWERDRINGGSEGIIQKAIKKLLQNEALIERWAPLLLKTELDNLLWRESDHISIKQLWEYLCTYCYLPRLANESVLINTIRNGAASPEYFAIAAGFDGKRYIDLKFNRQIESIEKSSLLVKPAAAKKQLAEEAAVRGENLPTGKEDAYAPPAESGNGLQENAPPAATPKIRRFYMSADLDATRINRDVQNYVEEIIQHLTASSGANVHVSLEVEAKSTEGFNQQTVRTVTENCRTLKVRDAGFEE